MLLRHYRTPSRSLALNLSLFVLCSPSRAWF